MNKYSNKIVIESLGLPMLTCFDDLVKEVSLSEKLVYWLTKRDAEGRYKTFFIKKKDGNKRKINAPSLALKIVQRWTLENILYKIKTSQYSYGFIHGHQPHRNHRLRLKPRVRRQAPVRKKAK